MKRVVLQGMLMLVGAGSALAAGGPEGEGMGLLVVLFFALAATIVLFQLIPSVILFFSLVKEMFFGRRAKAAPVAEREKVR